jgi:hypothetical protein
MTEIEIKLQEILEKLEASAAKIVDTQGYNPQVERLHLLEELVREQVQNANPRSSTRQAR